MGSIGQMFIARDKEIHAPGYRQRLALRDKPDYSNDLPEVKETIIIERQPIQARKQDNFY